VRQAATERPLRALADRRTSQRTKEAGLTATPRKYGDEQRDEAARILYRRLRRPDVDPDVGLTGV
jgi:hypothetical protein